MSSRKKCRMRPSLMEAILTGKVLKNEKCIQPSSRYTAGNGLSDGNAVRGGLSHDRFLPVSYCHCVTDSADAAGTGRRLASFNKADKNGRGRLIGAKYLTLVTVVFFCLLSYFMEPIILWQAPWICWEGEMLPSSHWTDIWQALSQSASIHIFICFFSVSG